MNFHLFWLCFLLYICSRGHCNSSPDRIWFPGEIRDKPVIKVTVPPIIIVKEPSPKPTPYIVEPPATDIGECGRYFDLGQFYDGNDGVESLQPYQLNLTAELYREKGYSVTVNELREDAIMSLTVTKGSERKTFALQLEQHFHVIGGRPALEARAKYMALIGDRRGDKTNWFCDGVLINTRWVLSAAHCFIEPTVDPNVIRLGDYDWAKKEFEEQPIFSEPIDYTIEDLVFYPDFELQKRYHDLVLIKLHKQIPLLSSRIYPICIPWGEETAQNLVGFNVTLTGWGSQAFNQRISETKPSILQEVDLEVFETKVCNDSYSQLDSFRRQWSEGMTEDDVLCVGWEQGGKDACKGDSGGPLVYQYFDTSASIFLVGIVSGGFGCGLKEYPGLYIPINRPKYLEWIKRVAF